MELNRNNNLLALDALVRANIDAQTKAQLFHKSVTQVHSSSNSETLSRQANQAFADLKNAFVASLQHKSLFYS